MVFCCFFFFFFKQKTAYEIGVRLVGSEMCIRDRYGIIKDSKGLSIPYNFFKGALKTDDNLSETARKSNQGLREFVGYLEMIHKNSPNLVSFDFEALKSDIASGMYFDSSIPQGYGVGSSGALVAAIYDKSV